MKRMLSIVLSLMLVLTSLPAVTLAETATPDAGAQVQQVETQTTSEVVAQPTATPTAQVSTPPVAADTETPVETEPAVEESQSPEPETTPSLSTDVHSLNFTTLAAGYEAVEPLSFTLTNAAESAVSLTYSELEAFTLSALPQLAAGEHATVSVTPALGLPIGIYTETLKITAGDNTITILIQLEVTAETPTVQPEDAATVMDVAAGTLDAPINLTATSTGYNTVHLSWDAVTGATGYKVYYMYSGIAYTWYADVTSVNTTYECTKWLTCGTRYYFKVMATDATTTSALSEAATTIPVPVTPTNVKATQTATNIVRISWDKLTSGAHGYRVYAKAGDDGTYALIATRSSISNNYADYTDL